ncbi:unnamed protein product [Prunus armeniaca]
MELKRRLFLYTIIFTFYVSGFIPSGVVFKLILHGGFIKPSSFQTQRLFSVKPSFLTGRLAKWALLLNQYEIIYTSAKAVKGQAVADFLADIQFQQTVRFQMTYPTNKSSLLTFLLLRMFFDGSARIDGAGAGVVFISLERYVLPYSFFLSELCSNNVAEYQALIMSLQMAI